MAVISGLGNVGNLYKLSSLVGSPYSGNPYMAADGWKNSRIEPVVNTIEEKYSARYVFADHGSVATLGLPIFKRDFARIQVGDL